jgi:hypothetical protein
LLLAATLTALLATLVLAALGGVMSHWNLTAGRLSAGIGARLALDQLEQDLQAAVFRADGNVWLAATILPDTSLSGQWRTATYAAQGKPGNTCPGTLNLTAAQLDDARFGVAGVWLRFITAKQAANSGATDLPAPAAVGYQIIRQNITSSSAAEQRYLLFRAEVRRTTSTSGAVGTFETGYNLDPAAVPATAYLSPSGTSGDPGNLLRPPLGSVLVDNVVDFGIRLYVRENGNLRMIFPAAPAAFGGAPPGGAATDMTPPAGETRHYAQSVSPAANDDYCHAFPEVADIMIRVLDDEGARLLAAYEAGRLRAPTGITAADYWWTLVESHSTVFTRRIEIPARPL